MSVGCSIFEHMFDEGSFESSSRRGDAGVPGRAARGFKAMGRLDVAWSPLDVALTRIHSARRPPLDLSSLADRLPGAGVLAQLSQIDRSALSPQDAVMVLQILERQLSWVHALESEVLVAAAGPEPTIDEYRSSRVIQVEDAIREEISSALKWGHAFTADRIDTARLLAGPCTATCEALERGDISQAHAGVIARAAGRMRNFLVNHPQEEVLFARSCVLLERRLLPTAIVGSLGRLRGAADRAVLALQASIDLERVRERQAQARADMDVVVEEEVDGISALVARMPTVYAHACLAAINARAGDERLAAPEGARIGHRRALALASMLLPDETRQLSAASMGSDSARGGDSARGTDVSPANPLTDDLGPRPRVHLNVVISAASLLGLSPEPGELVPGAGAGARPNGVLVTAAEVRELLANAGEIAMRRLVTDPMTGHLLDRGRSAYRVTGRLRDFIVARDRTCRFPGCTRPANLCEIDHAVPWDSGGATDRVNLGALCTRHHQLKTHAGWTLQDSNSAGGCTWRSPQGREYLSVPDPPPP